ncbi:MAG TPA: PP2C family protein-serine/threonine phosphatase, partial [Thermoanaerobaculia bacterium]|nr:PP2C family protein-serine/threonine phosphatase [Thermoanaerobaculia bacterium]
FPRAYPFFPRDWSVTPGEAEVVAVERLRVLAREGEWPAAPYVATDRVTGTGLVERRLLLASREVPLERLRESELAARVLRFRVTVYPAGGFPGEWAYRAEVAPDGSIAALRRRVEPDLELDSIDVQTAVAAADAFLAGQGFDLDRYSRPEARSRELRARTDLTLRYRSLEGILGEDVLYGLQVHFAGDRLTGFDSFYEDPDERDLQSDLQATGLWGQLQFLGIFLVAAVVAVVFLRRYHAGVVGVRRGLQIFAVALGSAATLLLLIAPALTEGQDWGIFTRQQITWVWGLQFLVVFCFPVALVAFLSWSVGESLCREGSSARLAAFDALFQGEWDNATVARAALRGPAAGLATLGGLLGLAVALRPFGVFPQVSLLLAPLWFGGPLPGLSLVAFSLLVVLFRELFGRLYLVPLATGRLGRWPGGGAAALVAGLLLFPFLDVVPVEWSLALAVAASGAMVALWLRYDLLTVLLASLTLQVGAGALPLILTDSPALKTQGWLALAVAALPAALSVRHLGSGREFVYRWDDVPPHVRRIAERERQRVELETARRIQSSILPELPPRLAGVDLAHAYLPATEVGGDFYDVLALEDGRLALAIGDVAGHGVSSGLVMSAAKSALAVQASFDPEVLPVFNTLNRMVYQSARRRLLATLCYALLDPARRELLFASAGHLYPHVLGADGRVRELASIAYPLGVRPELEIVVTKERLEPGDTLVLLSDGVVEAHAEGSAELYGFERLTQSLARHAGKSVDQIRDGILADVARFTGPAPREDDQTLLVLRVP